MSIRSSMQEGTSPEVDTIAKKLSLELSCTLRLSDLYKAILVCSHGIWFSVTRLKSNANWAWAKTKHDKAIN